MYKLILSAMLVLVSTSLFAGSWDSYKTISVQARESLSSLQSETNPASASTSLQGVVAACDATAQAAIDLDRPDIASWAYNNAAYANIVVFKKVCDYENITNKIETLSPKSQERIDLVRELQKTYAANLSLLDKATEFLDKASVTDKASSSKVTSNRHFISGIKAFINTKY